MSNFKNIPSFFLIKSKQIIHKIILTINYQVKVFLNHFIESLFHFFFTRKKRNIKSLFAFDIDPKNLKKKQYGAYAWLNYIVPNINKYSKYKFKKLKDINFRHHFDYNIERLIIFFPQGLGLEISSKLIKSSKKIIFYVNDNIIFCKRSYNTVFNKECFRCLKKFNPYPNCDHLAHSSKDTSYINFINTLKDKSKSILFICHSTSHVRIINSVFPKSKVMEFKNVSPEYKSIKIKKNNVYKHDFLFHANMVEAKGYFYFVKLAKANPTLNFFMPDYDLINSFYYKNIIFDRIRWNNGLKEKIYETKIILCPSFWSANFEGSVLKTMLMGKCCAIMKNKMSFSNDIPDNSVIKLSSNLKKDSKLLSKKLNDINEIEQIGKNARIWALNYIKNNPKKEINLLDTFFKN